MVCELPCQTSSCMHCLGHGIGALFMSKFCCQWWSSKLSQPVAGSIALASSRHMLAGLAYRDCNDLGQTSIKCADTYVLGGCHQQDVLGMVSQAEVAWTHMGSNVVMAALGFTRKPRNRLMSCNKMARASLWKCQVQLLCHAFRPFDSAIS